MKQRKPDILKTDTTSEDANKLGLVLKHTKKCSIPRIRIIKYTKEGYAEQELPTLPINLFEETKINRIWLNIDGLMDKELLNAIGTQFNIDQLVIDGLTDTNQRPRVQFYDKFVFISLKMLYLDPERAKEVNKKDVLDEIYIEQVSILFGPNFFNGFGSD